MIQDVVIGMDVQTCKITLYKQVSCSRLKQNRNAILLDLFSVRKTAITKCEQMYKAYWLLKVNVVLLNTFGGASHVASYW